MKKSFIILKIMLLGVVAGANGMDGYYGDGMDGYYPDEFSEFNKKKPIELAVQSGLFSKVSEVIDEAPYKEIEIDLALQHAGEYNKPQIAQNLIASYLYASRTEPLNMLMSTAAMAGNLEIVKFALKRGAQAENQTLYNTSPLIFAIMHRRDAIVIYLLEQGANREEKRACGQSHKKTPLMTALSYTIETAKAVLSAIIPDERKKIITAICALKNGTLDGCEKKFPPNIRQVITLILIDQCTHEHMNAARRLCYDATDTPETERHSIAPYKNCESIQEPASWNELTKRVRSNFCRIIRPPQEEPNV